MIGRIGASIGRLGLWSGASRLALGQLILDRLSPSAAIALRKMRTAYLGAAVRERRSSDNAEADIGFVGQELARNRFFSSATDWTLGANASISGSALVCAANTFTIAGQNMGLVTGRTYQITLRVNKTGSFPHARIRASTSNDPSLEGTNQTPLSAASPPNGPSVYSQKITANGPVLVIASSDAVWTGSIYSISVKDVGVVDQDIDLDVIEAMAFASGVTNLVPNPKALGAVVGNPGAPPTGWTFGAQNGLTTEIVSTGAADGVNYVDVRWSGVSTATGGIVGLFHSLNLPIGTILSGALSVGLIGGSLANVGGFQIRAGDGGAGHLLFTPSATFQRYQFTQTVAGTINARLTLRFNAQSIGAPIDFTLRLAFPVLVEGTSLDNYAPNLSGGLLGDNTGWAAAATGATLTPATAPWNALTEDATLGIHRIGKASPDLVAGQKYVHCFKVKRTAGAARNIWLEAGFQVAFDLDNHNPTVYSTTGFSSVLPFVQSEMVGGEREWTCYVVIVPSAAIVAPVFRPSLLVAGDATNNRTYQGDGASGLLITTLSLYATSASELYTAKGYDQSGNGNDAVQTVAARQPPLAIAGIIQRMPFTNKPAMYSDGNLVGLITAHSLLGYTGVYTSAVAKQLGNRSPGVASFLAGTGLVGSTGTRWMLQTGVVATRLDARPQTGAISVTGIGPLLANPAILAGRVNNNQMRAHANGALAVPVAVTLAPQAGDVFGIMSNGQASRSFWGYSNEFLLFPRDLSDAEHAALMADQSAYHGIALT